MKSLMGKQVGDWGAWVGLLIWKVFLVGIFFSGVVGAAEQAFLDAVERVKGSFEWDRLDGWGNPVVAEGLREPLEWRPEDLRVVAFDPADPERYRSLLIGGAWQECALVCTYTRRNDFWKAAIPGNELHLNTGAYDLFSWVTFGDDLKEYLVGSYGSTLTAGNLDRRVSQALGMEDRTTAVEADKRGLAFYWVPLGSLLRPAYSANVSTQIDYLALPTYREPAGGAYGVADPGAGGPTFQFQDYQYRTYTGDGGFGEFVMHNQAGTEMPWTAMGYTYNWNYLEDGSGGRALDASRVDSYAGVSEFVVSAGAWVQFERFVGNDELFQYVVPEPGVWVWMVLAGVVGLGCRRRCPR